MFSLALLIVSCSPKGEVDTSNEITEKVQIAAPPIELKAQQEEAAKEALTLFPLSPEEVTPAPAPTTPEKLEITITQPPTTPTAQAEIPSAAEPVPFQPTTVEGGLAVELVLDASGSMNGLLGTETKMNIAKSLLQDLTPQWATLKQPPLSFALRLLGATTSLEANQCDDSQLLIPFGPIDPTTVQQKLAQLQPKGSSPIAYALEKAGEDLAPLQKDRVLILVADGRDTCQQDPCSVAKALHEGHFKIVTHVVGFDLAAADEAGLKCIADASKGSFFLARTREELASALDEALRSTVPYNLRLKVLVGGTPLESTITVFKAGTQEAVEKNFSFGIELFRLKPGAYDILVEYAKSIEESKPSKIIKGVELPSQGKVEQEIRFDLANVTLSAHDPKGGATGTEYTFYKAGTEEEVASFQSGGEETMLYIQPGNYDIVANRTTPGQEMKLIEPNVAVSLEQGFVKHFAFQTGSLVLKVQDPQKKPVAVLYQVSLTGKPDSVVAKGQTETTGGTIDLPPGTYDIKVEGMDPAVKAEPIGELKEIKIEGGAIQEQTIVLKIGTLHLVAKMPDDKPAPTEFRILKPEDGSEVAKIQTQDGKASFGLPPGKYDIEAALLSAFYTKSPTAEVKGVNVEEGKSLEQIVSYQLGILKLFGRNAKEQKIETTFYVYAGGTEEVVATAGPVEGWIQFELAPDNYDIKAVDTKSTVDPKPQVWLRDVTIETNALYVKEAVFTNAKVRLIGRGTNNEIIPVEFKIYEYNHDRPIVDGTTGQDWQSIDLQPGKYYIEAAYHDPDSSQLLKKWINLAVEENELVEKEIRF